jgi:very-short-patch-repair endonuclease
MSMPIQIMKIDKLKCELQYIVVAFKGENMKTQHPVLDYRIDLYFPDYNLAIECDENGHSDRSPAEERRRRRRITKKINCQWLRFNPDSTDFNIFDVINQIFTIII